MDQSKCDRSELGGEDTSDITSYYKNKDNRDTLIQRHVRRQVRKESINLECHGRAKDPVVIEGGLKISM